MYLIDFINKKGNPYIQRELNFSYNACFFFLCIHLHLSMLLFYSLYWLTTPPCLAWPSIISCLETWEKRLRCFIQAFVSCLFHAVFVSLHPALHGHRNSGKSPRFHCKNPSHWCVTTSARRLLIYFPLHIYPLLLFLLLLILELLNFFACIKWTHFNHAFIG